MTQTNIAKKREKTILTKLNKNTEDTERINKNSVSSVSP